jgi:hypothetical protein
MQRTNTQRYTDIHCGWQKAAGLWGNVAVGTIELMDQGQANYQLVLAGKHMHTR